MSSCAKGDNLVMAKQNNPNGGQQCHKKQVRRRLHTSRPYQERLLNMAEARKEIVTALKFHRASMKQANERKQPLPQPQLLSKSMVSQHTQYQYKELIVGVQNHESCKSRNEISSLCTTLPCNMSQNSVSSSNNNISNHAPNSHTSALIESPTIYKTLDIPLPPLGLNLNLQAITNLYTPTNTSTSYPSPPLRIPTNPTSTATPGGDQVGPTSGSNGVDQAHHGIDEDEMAKIMSIGDQHQMEWDDTLDLVKSTWWFKFLKSLEFGKEMKGVEKNYHDNNYECLDPFGEFMEFPAWLSANDDENFLHENLDDYYFSKDYDKDDALPWMDIEDIDGMDDEWLSNLS